jgi:superfamily II DNA or RNA helicase
MKLPFTLKMLEDWGGAHVLRQAQGLVERGQVAEASFEPPLLRGSILASARAMKTALKLLPNGHVESLCPCWDNKERGIICAHVIALGIVLVKRATDPNREAKAEAELKRAARLASLDESKYLRRVPATAPGAIPASLILSLGRDWQTAWNRGCVPVTCEVKYAGKTLPADQVSCNLPLSFSKQDESLLFVLEDIAEGPVRGRLELKPADFLNVIRLHAGKPLPNPGGQPITINQTPMKTFVQMDLDRENGELILIAHTELPFMSATDFPFYMVAGKTGWAYGADNLWPLVNVLPEPYHPIYRDPVVIARKDVPSFFARELPLLAKQIQVETDLSDDLFTLEPGMPKFRLAVRGSPASMAATLYARYDDIELVACKPDPREHFSLPDPGDLMRYSIRNPAREQKALELLAAAGFTGERGDELASVVGTRQVLNFLGTHLPALRRRGWKVELEGRLEPYMESLNFATPVVHIDDSKGGAWFDIGYNFETQDGSSIAQADIQLALRKGDSFFEKNGTTYLIDSGAVDAMQNIFSDCASQDGDQPGHFRLANIYAPFVKSALEALDGIDMEDTPSWRNRAGQYNRTLEITPVQLGEPLNGILRSYQHYGVSWLRFMEANGFCGLLADEMGLGKTLQTLAWLQLQRHSPDARGKPALIVCPTTLVENWAEEAAKFVPGMKVLNLTGTERADRWAQLDKTDIAVTSYAILRRDVDNFTAYQFSAAILDEAQHIKNRSTQNALAAKQIKAFQRLVLTGTPIENSVSDLWSIMDFLMPGYLGSHQAFKFHYEDPIAEGAAEGEIAQAKLRRKLHPFMLRRLKSEVARDLPPKIQKISSCNLTGDQQAVYLELLEESRQKISDMVKAKGFEKCRMEILVVLMRLRQICCHLDLLKLPDLKAKNPSAKMDLFFELVEEALDGGHRILVFSQFVGMLTILRKELERQGLAYCYLDGSTKERMKVVHQFNSQREIPIFLISLKAGGTGLNLTGADMVIHFDPWWNPAVEDQATDRAYRIGQKRTVYSLKLITRGTVEEKVLAMQRKKKAVIDATLTSDENVMQKLDWNDIQELLAE